MQASPAQRVALAFGELLLQSLWRCQKVLPIYFQQLQSGCDSRFCRRQNSDELRERELASALSAVFQNEIVVILMKLILEQSILS
ncbi:MAG: hypothetical protein IJE95_06030 [Methanocorpusculum sp.]|nr:hypothetical protein [Methanocorpusculum sp.]